MIIGNYEVHAIVVDGTPYLSARNLLTFEEEREQIKAIMETGGQPQQPTKRQRDKVTIDPNWDASTKLDMVIFAYENDEQKAAAKFNTTPLTIKELVRQFEAGEIQ